MNAAQSPDSLEPVDYLGVLRRRWLMMVVLTCVGLAGGFAYVMVAPKSYSATAAVNVTPTGASQGGAVANGRTNGPVNLDTEAQIVTSTKVAAIAGKLLHSSLPPSALSKQISVTVPPNSSVLDIACSASSGTEAATCAQDFANAYLQNRSQTAQEAIKGQIGNLQTEASGLQKKASTLSGDIRSLPKTSAKRLTDENNLKSIKTELHYISNQEGSLTGLLANTAGGSIITNPLTPTQPSSPKKSLVLPSGAVAGLLLGLVIAFVWDRRDKRIHGAGDVRRALNLPVMLDLPGSAVGRQVSLASPRSQTGRSFTELAYGVTAALDEGSQIVLVAGTASGAGASIVAANLAATLARTHGDTVLVCANLSDSIAPELLGLNSSGPGLAELVAGTASVREAVRAPAGVPGLWVITPGGDASLAVYHLQHDTAQALMSDLRKKARYVVIEAKATEEGVDTLALGALADAALVAVEVSRTTTTEATACIRRLHQLRTPVLSAVVHPALSSRISVRPPRPAVSADAGRERLDSPRNGEIPAALPGNLDNRNQPLRTRSGYDPADRVRGGR